MAAKTMGKYEKSLVVYTVGIVSAAVVFVFIANYLTS